MKGETLGRQTQTVSRAGDLTRLAERAQATNELVVGGFRSSPTFASTFHPILHSRSILRSNNIAAPF